MCCKTPEKPATRECKFYYYQVKIWLLLLSCQLVIETNKTNLHDLVNFSGNEDPRKRPKSFKNFDAKNESSMSVMMKEDASYLDNAVVSKSKAKLFKELTCIVMQSSNYIKTLPEVDEAQLAKKVCLPYTKDHQSG